MPGIVGFSRPETEGRAPKWLDAAEQMQRAITHRSTYQQSEVERRDGVYGAASLLYPLRGAIEANVHRDEDLQVWVHGELLESETGGAGPAEYLARCYRRHDDFQFLARFDGLFAAVIHDTSEGRVHLMTDRLGLKFLFWSLVGGQLVWGTEVKAFLAHPDFEPVIDERSMEDFLEYGQMRDNETWFTGVELVDPGSVLSYDLSTGELDAECYWSWSDLDGPAAGSPVDSPGEAADRMGELFVRAVRKRSDTDRRYGLGLSGGLDSRAILAALPDEVRRTTRTFTFGLPDSWDGRIARQIAERFEVDHRMFPIDETNWLEGRYDGVWLTDGHSPIRHLHSMVCLDTIPGMFDINLNGFLGDAIQGGMYFSHSDAPLTSVVSNRGRRLINQGVRLFEVFQHNRRPFIDNDLVDFTLSLPREWLADGAVYEEMLLRGFPDYFRDIPCDATRSPIGWPDWRVAIRQWWLDTVDNVRALSPFGREPLPGSFVAYRSWLAGPTYREEVESLLFGSDPLYREYRPDLSLRPIWEAMVSGENHPDWRMIARVMTFEIWLQQVYEQRWRPTE